MQRRISAKCTDAHAFAIMHIDLDKFKQINDTMGHKAGDFVLEKVAERLKSAARTDDFIARIGGDEFVLLYNCVDDPKNISKFADRLVEAIGKPLLFEGVRCDVYASIGIEIIDLKSSDVNVDLSNFLANADLALYKAKALGGSCHQLFCDELKSAHLQSLNLKDEIANAISSREFVPYYQLQYDAHTKQLISGEALVRWRHPERGILAPNQFLDDAIEMGFGQEIDHLIMKSALSDLTIWKSDPNCPIQSVAVNLNADSIGDQNFIDRVSQLHIPKGSLSFEITETVNIDKSSRLIIDNVEALKDMGFNIEIDDFGTGHASILCLQYLKPSRLKIDREFIFPIVEDADQRRLVKSIIDLSRPFNVKVVAEGVESMAHADILAGLGCDILQGFALCKPIPAIGVTAMLHKQERALRHVDVSRKCA